MSHASVSIGASRAWKSALCAAVLRKGGLRDKGGFQLQASSFLLLPTSFHSAAQYLAEEEHHALKQVRVRRLLHTVPKVRSRSAHRTWSLSHARWRRSL